MKSSPLPFYGHVSWFLWSKRVKFGQKIITLVKTLLLKFPFSPHPSLNRSAVTCHTTCVHLGLVPGGGGGHLKLTWILVSPFPQLFQLSSTILPSLLGGTSTCHQADNPSPQMHLSFWAKLWQLLEHNCQLSSKSVQQKCPAKVSSKTVQQKCPAKLVEHKLSSTTTHLSAARTNNWAPGLWPTNRGSLILGKFFIRIQFD